jgi:hypothetical protein
MVEFKWEIEVTKNNARSGGNEGGRIVIIHNI